MTAQQENSASLARVAKRAQADSAKNSRRRTTKKTTTTKAPKPRSPESLAAARATELRASGRSVGPAQVRRVLAALGDVEAVDDVVKASGAKSLAALRRMATGEDADVTPLRELGAKVPDGYAKGRWLACVLVAIAEQRAR